MPHPNVLVVEDHREVRAMLLKYLQRIGCEAIGEPDGRSALARARKDPPDLILLDMRLPGLDGGEILPKLRKTRGLERVPVIGMSGYAHAAMEAQALERGCTRFIAKPIRLEDLRKTIVEVLGYEPERFS